MSRGRDQSPNRARTHTIHPPSGQQAAIFPALSVSCVLSCMKMTESKWPGDYYVRSGGYLTGETDMSHNLEKAQAHRQ